ncbi:hypothetical protein EMCRGX_G030501 [Ephydatia muelleri]
MAKLARAVKKNLTPVSYEIATGDSQRWKMAAVLKKTFHCGNERMEGVRWRLVLQSVQSRGEQLLTLKEGFAHAFHQRLT